MSAAPVLRVDALDAGYGRLQVVRDLHLELRAGEVVGLLGPNGAGKTTALLTIAGLLRPLGGTVELDGRDVTSRPAHRLARDGLALVPDDRGLFPGLTVDEHLRLVRAGADDRERVAGWFPQLAALGDRRVGLLSGGEQQMLALAQALLRRPRVLMIDEMSLGLAPIVVESLLPIVRRIAEDSGCAVLLVEQHAPMALEVADRALVMSHGAVVADGTSGELLADWDSLLAGYLGG